MRFADFLNETETNFSNLDICMYIGKSHLQTCTTHTERKKKKEANARRQNMIKEKGIIKGERRGKEIYFQLYYSDDQNLR